MMLYPPALYVLPLAFLLDILLGDPAYMPHPVRWMGNTIESLEPRFRKVSLHPTYSGLLFAVGLALGTLICTSILLNAAGRLHPALRNGLEIICIYYCLSARSLNDAALEVRKCLQQNNVALAREKVALIVGRDVSHYDREGIARAAVETVAENLVDGVISPLFFAAIGGAPLALAYKMINTLDSMVGYKNEKYRYFGRGAAKIDDGLNYIPARLAIPVIALAAQLLSGKGSRAFKTALAEGSHHSSPNAGQPEAAFAGALAVKLNGPNIYDGQLVDKPYIGVRFGKVNAGHIKKACDVMMLAAFLWLIGIWATATLFRFFF